MSCRVFTPSRFAALLLTCCLAFTSASGYNFSVSTLQGVTLSGATSLQFGPDHRLYVSQVNGVIKALTVQRVSANNYTVTATETINLIRDIPNYDDSGTRNFSLTSRQVTGLLVVGNATNPVLYVTSSDPRIGGGSGGENDLNLDTNSGVISRLTRSGTTWSKVDLVRGLPRSEENHASNGMQLEPLTNTLYLAQGGNTNAGGPSINFAYACETALSGAILSIDLTAINAMPVKTDAYGQKYVYNIPTLNDPNAARAHNSDGSDVNDPFGGNDGLNQSKWVPGGPVQIYSPGYRNSYDVVLTRAPNREGRLYTFDNGANSGWGGYPRNEGGGSVTNQYVAGEPGSVNNLDNLHLIPAKGYYGGHPNPMRANPAGAGWFYFDNTQPAGSQQIYATQPTADWPPVPVSLATPVEGDYRQPGSADGALLTNNQSTNGLTEYIGTNFSGEMQGNLLAASYDGRLLRIALSPDGTAVTNGLETLATGFGSLPLDVTAPDPGKGSAFVGTIWVAHYSPAKISILEPADFDSPGGATCTGINSFDVDEDTDGYSNADEIANDSDPCSGAIRPPDVDGDKVSDLLDQDDDNDSIDDTQDVFPLDAENGNSVPMPVRYELFNSTGLGFFGVGFTGVMMNRGDDYLNSLSHDNVIAGGTAGLFTVAKAGGGVALGSTNTQKDAYQFGINSNEFTTPFVISSRLAGPYFGNTPSGSQRQGIYMGTGDQNNYIWIAIHANNGAGGFEVVYELGGTIVSQKMYPFSGLTSNSTIDLSFVVDPVAGTIQPGYRTASSSVVSLGTPLNVTGAMLQSVMGSQPLAIGLFATTGGTAPTFSATWDYFDVTPLNSTSIAKVTIDSSATDITSSSTYTNGSFQIQNLSTGGQHIETVTIDLTTAMFPDMVYDPNGTAGDTVAKPFQANSASTGVSVAGGVMRKPHNGTSGADGYDELEITFNSFPANGTFTFSIDCDPTSIKGASGSVTPGSVSGLELIGSTVEVFFSDGTVHRTRLGRVANSVDGSYGWLRSDEPPQPGIAFIGKSSPLKSGVSPETVRVTGPAGLTASVVMIEGALNLATVPNGGYDLDLFEANSAIKVTEVSGAITSAGYRDFSISPTKTNADGGYNYISAVLSDAASIKGPVSDKLALWYDPSFTGTDSQPPTAIQSLTSPNITSRSITLSWSASSDNIGVQAYDVFRDGTLVTSIDSLSLSYTDIGLDAGITHNYSVVARDAAGNVSPATTLTARTPSNGSVVLRVNAGGPAFVDSKGNNWIADTGYNTGTTTSVTNSIDRAIDDTLFQTDRIDSSSTAPDLAYAFSVANGDYEVQLFFAELSMTNAAVGGRVFDVVIESQLAFDNLDVFALAGAPYTAVVVAANTSVTDGQLNIAFPRGTSNPKVNAVKLIKLSAPETVPPSTPANFKTTNVTSNSVTLAWNASTDNIGVTGYVVARNGVTIQTTPDLSITDTGLSSSTAYQYSVRAVDDAGNLSSAATLSVTTLSGTADTQPPTAPGGLSFTSVTSNSITVKWTAATDNVGVKGYRVSRGATELATITGLSFIDTGLTAGTSYTYSVVAVDAAGNASAPSSAAASTNGGGTSSTIRVNAGGASYVDAAGNTWSADTGYNTGSVATTTTNVSGTTDPTLYKTSRYPLPTNPPLVYSFAVPNGNYLVRLHFAETYTGTMAVGKRVFDIDIQSARAFENVDIFAQAGGNKALVLEKTTSVTNGQVTIGFVRQVENPKINAIEIVLAPSSGPVRINAGGPAYVDTAGNTWLADSGYSGGTTSTTAATISGTTEPTLYKTSRYPDPTALTLTYTLAVPNGNYLVRLHFAETYTGTMAIGKRVFDIDVQSARAFEDLDIFARVGGNKALVLEKTASVTNGQVKIDFVRQVENPKINAIEIIPSSTTPDTQLPTTPGTLTFNGVTSNSVTINWTAATDNVGVTGYRISRGTTVLSTVTDLNFTDTGLSASTSYTYSVVALDAAGNVSPGRTGTISTTSGGTATGGVRVNAGGPSYVDTAGNTWSADTGFNTGSVATTTTTVTGTTNPTLYKTSRYPLPTDPPLTYTLSVPNGSYLVRLHFAETHTGTMALGKRVFDIDIQSSRAFEDVDIFARVGANKALILEMPANVTNGQVKIGFIRQVENPKINAIEVVPATVVRINAGGPSYAGAGGATWSADTGYNTGAVTTSTATITGTNDPTLFKTERYESSTNPPLIYSIPVTNGKYMVRLYFAETYSATQGASKRVFDVDIEAVRAFDNIDIFTMAGGGNKALVLEKATTVTDGQVNIQFVRQTQNPKINAIEIFSIP